MTELLAVLGLGLLCGAWVLIQRRAEKEGCSGGGGCGACGGGKCSKNAVGDSET